MAKVLTEFELLNKKFSTNVDKNDEPFLKAAIEITQAKTTLYKGKIKDKDTAQIALMCCLDIAMELEKTNHQLNEFQQHTNKNVLLLNQSLSETLETLAT